MMGLHGQGAAAQRVDQDRRRPSFSAAVVDGLLTGLAAGAAALLVLIAAAAAAGRSLLALLQALGPTGESTALQGLLALGALCALCGAVWGIVAAYGVQRTHLPCWAAGLLFGAGLWLVAWTFLGQNRLWEELPPILLPASFLTFGLVLGLLLPHLQARPALPAE